MRGIEMPATICGDHYVITRGNHSDVIGVFLDMESAKVVAQCRANDAMDARRFGGATVHYVIETWNGVECNWVNDIHVYGVCSHKFVESDATYCNNCGKTLYPVPCMENYTDADIDEYLRRP